MRHHSRSIATDGTAEPPATVARPDRGRNGRPLLQLAGPTHVPSTGRLDALGQQTLLQHALTESTAKDRTRVLLLEGINETAANVLAGTGFRNLSLLPRALAGADLGDALRGVTLLGIRSSTRIDERVLARAENLIAIGCFSVGTNQVDLEAARRRGIPVFNAPHPNTRSVAELVIGEIIMLFRRIFPRSAAAHAGQWQKSAAGCFEVRGKTLGIVGYGNIGSQLSTLAEAIGMRVISYDIADRMRYGNAATAASLDDLLRASDVVSLHVPETPQTLGMIGATEIAAMRQGSFLINNSRGSVVDLDALADALRRGHLGGAAVDTFPVEPTSSAQRFASPLRGLDNVILTPHIGGSTREAQERIGTEVAGRLAEYGDAGSTTGAVNFPAIQLPPCRAGTRFVQIQRNGPGMPGRLNDVFTRRSINISAQFYQRDDEIGYAALDAEVAGPEGTAILRDIMGLEGTIRARIA